MRMAVAMDSDVERNPRNHRTALILVSVALVFFIGVVARRWFLGG
jgi:hypothetical protein